MYYTRLEHDIKRILKENIGPCHKEGYAVSTPPLRSGHLCIKDEECAELNKKSYLRFFRFLVFELLAAKELPMNN